LGFGPQNIVFAREDLDISAHPGKRHKPGRKVGSLTEAGSFGHAGELLGLMRSIWDNRRVATGSFDLAWRGEIMSEFHVPPPARSAARRG
jgi:hypothetical protein